MLQMMSNISDGTRYELLNKEAEDRSTWKLMEKMEVTDLL